MTVAGVPCLAQEKQHWKAKAKSFLDLIFNLIIFISATWVNLQLYHYQMLSL